MFYFLQTPHFCTPSQQSNLEKHSRCLTIHCNFESRRLFNHCTEMIQQMYKQAIYYKKPKYTKWIKLAFLTCIFLKWFAHWYSPNIKYLGILSCGNIALSKGISPEKKKWNEFLYASGLTTLTHTKPPSMPSFSLSNQLILILFELCSPKVVSKYT